MRGTHLQNDVMPSKDGGQPLPQEFRIGHKIPNVIDWPGDHLVQLKRWEAS